MKRAFDGAAANWDEIADGWAGLMGTATGPGQTRTLVLDGPHLQLLGDVRGEDVLDAGCGEGRFARMLAERGAHVRAIAISSVGTRAFSSTTSWSPCRTSVCLPSATTCASISGHTQ